MTLQKGNRTIETTKSYKTCNLFSSTSKLQRVKKQTLPSQLEELQSHCKGEQKDFRGFEIHQSTSDSQTHSDFKTHVPNTDPAMPLKNGSSHSFQDDCPAF